MAFADIQASFEKEFAELEKSNSETLRMLANTYENKMFTILINRQQEFMHKYLQQIIEELAKE